jgi:large subunit ribosomal protein L29
MRADEIRELGDDEIRTRIAELEEERFRLRFRSATEPLEDPLRFRVIRKDVARLHTVLRERELAGTSTPASVAKTPKTKAAKKSTTSGREAKSKKTRSRAAR